MDTATTRSGSPRRHAVRKAPPTPFAEATPPFTREAALNEAERCLFCFDAPCAIACPTHIDIASFIRSIATGNPLGSARTILASNPLGATCASACPVEVLCEGACVHNDVDRPIAIGRLQRHAMDALADSGQPFFRAGAATGKRVAVVGGGPAGLSCAAVLRGAGVDVTIYEARERAGGLCDAGIVPWRLTRSVPELEVAEVERVGATIRTGIAVGRDVSLASLVDGHDAVFIGVGLSTSRSLGVPGEESPGVRDALDVLKQVSAGVHDAAGLGLGPRVAVIGGGSTALDAVAVAAKAGCAEVTLFYRRTEVEAPAHPHSIELARALGVRLAWLTAPAAIAAGDGGVEVTFETMRLGDPDASGRRAPVPVEGGEFTGTFDTVLRAVGHAVDGAGLDAAGLARAGTLIVADADGRTGNPRIWAAGDAVNGGAEVVDAVADAVRAAHSIAATLGVALPAAKSAGPSIEVPRASGPAAVIDLSTDVAGIRSPNPFWLASAPPTNSGEMIARAFEAGWGGAVWKTIGDPIVNVSPRLGAIHVGGKRITGLNNIELITDRSIEVNIAELAAVKRLYPDRAVVASLMYPMDRKAWHEIVKRINDTGADGYELNFGCPHGMAERGMGAAVGQVPEFAARCTEYVKEVSTLPVLVKLTPNVTDITAVAAAVVEAGADGLAMINTINSLVGVDLASFAPDPAVAGMGSHGGYAGPAVKPIALHMVQACAASPEVRGVPISGIGGIATWRDAAEFMLMGSSSVQVCTAVMHYGHRIIDDLISGLAGYVASMGLTRAADLVGRTVPKLTTWGNLDQDFHVIAKIDQDRCIHCNACHAACEDGAHQSIELRRDNGRSHVQIVDDTCVGCRLCELVCPVEGCITMVRSDRAPVEHARPVPVARV